MTRGWWRAFALPLAVVLAGPAAALTEADIAHARVAEPRAFGWRVGDLVDRVVTVDAPAGATLDDASLPRGARQGQALELRRFDIQSERASGRQRWRLALRYQVFLAPEAVTTLDLPGFTLRVRPAAAGAAVQELRIETWPLAVAPLTPPQATMRRGLGELQPDDAAPPAPARAARRWLLACTLLALPPLAYLGWAFAGAPWLASRRRPFHQAWRALRGLPDAAAPEAYRQALQRLHQALNQAAGQVLFERDLPAFLAREPRFAALADELAAFFQQSRRAFFEAAPASAGGDTAALRTLCRRCRDVERGLA